MRKLIYCLADGHKVDSLTKAKESGQTYTVTCEVIQEPVHITEKQKARRIKIQRARCLGFPRGGVQFPTAAFKINCSSLLS